MHIGLNVYLNVYLNPFHTPLSKYTMSSLILVRRTKCGMSYSLHIMQELMPICENSAKVKRIAFAIMSLMQELPCVDEFSVD